jgi:surfactin synthase thioesterase subunit
MHTLPGGHFFHRTAHATLIEHLSTQLEAIVRAR